MSNKACSDLYTTIIDDVIFESRQDFENAGIDEQTLLDLREIWRQKLQASGVCKFSWVGNDDDEDDENEDSEQKNVQTEMQQMQGIPQLSANALLGEEDDSKTIKPEPLDMLPKPEELIPESVTANPETLPPAPANSSAISTGTSKKGPNVTFTLDTTTKELKFDDIDDSDDDLGSDLGADSDAINSDLDDSDDNEEDDVDGNEDGDSEMEQNIMLCLYDRVQRVRNRWKCSLKDGIMNIDGKDYVFQKANGDSEW